MGWARFDGTVALKVWNVSIRNLTTDGEPNIGTLSSIYKPSLPEDEENLGALCVSWDRSVKEPVISYDKSDFDLV